MSNLTNLFYMLFFTVVLGVFSIMAYQSAQAFKIYGEGFGNNGARFKSFVVCPDGQKHFFDGGAYLQLAAAGNKINGFGNISGQFAIRYYDSLGNTEHESGFFLNGVISKPSYLLQGTETTNTVCNSTSKITVILFGLCGDNVNINYASADRRTQSGSTSLPSSTKASSFFGSKVVCIMD